MKNVITRAFELACEAHKHQKRKMSNLPYIIHPMEVAIILIKNHAPDDLVAAGLLHDVVEDTEITIEEIEKKFGPRIAHLVKEVTEPAKLHRKLKKSQEKSTWKERKLHTINSIKSASFPVKLLSCADKLANIRSTIHDYEIIGEKVWEKFNAQKESQKWYYTSMLNSFSGGKHSLKNTEAFKEFKACLKQLFG